MNCLFIIHTCRCVDVETWPSLPISLSFSLIAIILLVGEIVRDYIRLFGDGEVHGQSFLAFLEGRKSTLLLAWHVTRAKLESEGEGGGSNEGPLGLSLRGGTKSDTDGCIHLSDAPLLHVDPSPPFPPLSPSSVIARCSVSNSQTAG
jgi:hypothetical protein